MSLTVMFAAVAAGATVLTLAMPFMATDTLGKRMKAVALEREKIRAARARAHGAGQQGRRCGNRRKCT